MSDLLFWKAGEQRTDSCIYNKIPCILPDTYINDASPEGHPLDVLSAVLAMQARALPGEVSQGAALSMPLV